MIIKSIDTLMSKLDKYINSKESIQRFRIVNVNNEEDYIEVLNRLSDKLRVIHMSDYCYDNSNEDSIPNIDKLLVDIKERSGNLLIVGFSQHLKIQGKDSFQYGMESILSINSCKTKAVILCYDTAQYFINRLKNDIRLENIILILSGEKHDIDKLCFTSMELTAYGKDIINGYNNYLKYFETSGCSNAIVATKHYQHIKSNQMMQMEIIRNGYDLIVNFDKELCSIVDENIGTGDQWNKLFKNIKGKTVREYLEMKFNDLSDLDIYFSRWREWTIDERWLFYIALNFEKQHNEYLEYVISVSTDFVSFNKNLYFLLLNFSWNDPKFMQYYSERKRIVKYIDDSNLVDAYCITCKLKKNDRVYYFTDLTSLELENLFEWLAEQDYITKEVEEKISVISKDISDYLKCYDFKDKLFNEYFNEYKLQKLNNKVYLNFIEKVNLLAKTREYNKVLPTRYEIFERIDRNDSKIYFIDALGVEFLGYIISQCSEMGLHIKVNVVKANIPTTTENNKEFLEGLKYVDIKDLDKLKHSGENGYDYELNNLPLHIPRELEIIKAALNDIKTDLSKVSKVIIVSDHGASRLVVLNNNKIRYDVDLSGSSGGRYCNYVEGMEPIEYATLENGKYVLANYDRFKSYGSPRVETHGGAALEEVMVPIIEVTKAGGKVTALVIERIIKIDFRTKPELKILLNKKLPKITVKVNGKSYESTNNCDCTFSVPINDIKKPGKYFATIYDGDNYIDKIEFTIEKAAAREVELF